MPPAKKLDTEPKKINEDSDSKKDTIPEDRVPRGVMVPWQRYLRIQELAKSLKEMVHVPPERQRPMSMRQASAELDLLLQTPVTQLSLRKKFIRKTKGVRHGV